MPPKNKTTTTIIINNLQNNPQNNPENLKEKPPPKAPSRPEVLWIE